jgi:uncharacterized membrane protein required for colicin V production
VAKIDIVFLICWTLAIAWGYFSGLTGMVLQFSALVLGAFFYPEIFAWAGTHLLNFGFESETVAILLLILTILPLLLAAWYLGKLSGKILKMMFMQWLNRLLGAFIALISAWIITVPFFLVLTSLPPEQPLLSAEACSESYICPVLKIISEPLKARMLPPEMLEFILQNDATDSLP